MAARIKEEQIIKDKTIRVQTDLSYDQLIKKALNTPLPKPTPKPKKTIKGKQ